MACTSCGQKQQAMTNTFFRSLPKSINNEPCIYTREELQDKLIASLISQNWSQVSFLRSAIGRYDINCNEFNNYIL